jgi:aldehyde dehydrogenase (NAD+)
MAKWSVQSASAAAPVSRTNRSPRLPLRQSERHYLRTLLLANTAQYGLTGIVFTRALARGSRFAERVQVGRAHVNDQSVIDLPTSLHSGARRTRGTPFNGNWSIEAVTTDQWATVQHMPRRYPWAAGDVQGP